MAEDSINWLLAIGASFDPAPDMKERMALLDEASTNWSKKSLKGGKEEQYYRDLIESFPDAKSALGNEGVVLGLSEEAKKLVYGAIDEASQFAWEGGELRCELRELRDVVNKLVRARSRILDYELDESALSKRVKQLGYSMEQSGDEGDSDEKGTYERYNSIKIPRERNYKNAASALSLFGADSLYDYAGGEGVSDPRQLSNKDLIENSKKIAAPLRKNTSRRRSADDLVKACETAFSSDETRADYDAYLRKTALSNALADLGAKAKLRGGVASIKMQQSAVEEVADLIDEKKDARAVVVGYCKVKGIELERDPEFDTKVSCRCGHLNDRDATICSRCGLPLEVTCPNCCASVSNSEDRCPGCGKPIGVALDEARSLSNRARTMAARLDFDEALSSLGEAERAWPGLTSTSDAEAAVKRLAAHAEEISRKYRSALERGRYVEALELLKKSKSIHGIDLVYVSGQERSIFPRVEEAGALAEEAAAAKDEATAASLYEQALSLCADLPAALAFFSSHPPLPVTGVSAAVDSRRGVMVVSWQPSESGGALSYTVFAHECGGPVGEQAVGETDATSLAHSSVTPGKAYQYYVVTERGGTRSRPSATTAPVAVTPGVEDLRAVPNHGCVELIWKPLPSSADVTVRETSGKVGPQKARGSRIVIDGLRDGLSYTFVVEPQYVVPGVGKVLGGSAECSVTPIDPSSYVERLTSRSAGMAEGTFELSWDDPGVPVRFYGTPQRGGLPSEGVALSIGELERRFEEQHVKIRGNGVGTLFRAEGAPIYVFAASVFGSTAVVGASARVAPSVRVDVGNVEVLNGKLSIDVTCADPSVNGFVVLISRSRFVDDLDTEDPSVIRKPCGAKAWRQSGGKLSIPDYPEGHLYISVFARTGGSGELFFSDPGRGELSPQQDIVYTMSASGGLFGGRRVTFDFMAADGGTAFTLPDVRILCAEGRPPLGAPNAVELGVIPSVEVTGGHHICKVTLPRGKNLYVGAYPVSASTSHLRSLSGYLV